MFKYSQAELTVLPIALAISVFIGLLVGFLLRKKSNKVKNFALVAVTVILLGMEVAKQYLAIKSGSYSLWNIPLHYCSMFMLWYILASLAKGKVQQVGRSLAFSSTILFFIAFYVSPSSIIGGSSANVFGSFGNFHTFFYHHFIIVFFVLLLSLKLYHPKWWHLKWVVIAYVSYFVVAVTMANLLNTNFASVLHNVVVFMDNIRINSGYFAYLVFMFAVGVGGNALFHSLFTCVASKKQKSKAK